MPPASACFNSLSCASLQRPWCTTPLQQPTYSFFYSPNDAGSQAQVLASGVNADVTLTAPLHLIVELTDAAAGSLALQETVFNANATPLPATFPVNGLMTLFLGTQGTLTVLVVQNGDTVPVDFIVPSVTSSYVYQYEIASGTGAFFNASGYVQITVTSLVSARQLEVYLNV